ncbi:MAG TPA: YdcF family protein [Chloroflexota bacterium]|nr:YdcF family protein [Chloroflexota bacterium]
MRRIALVALAILVVIAILSRHTWLTAIGDGLVARDEVGSADVIVVLAGNSPFRARHAESLYARGLAPNVIISNEPLSSHGVQTTWLELRQHGLVRLAIPDEAIVPISEISDSTYEEALRSREIMQSHGWRSAILVTDPFHMRRALLTFRQAFGPAGLAVSASPADGSKYGVDNWWTDRNAIMRVAQEYFKLGYYMATGRV